MNQPATATPNDSTAPQMQHVQANGLSFCVETRGNPKGEPVLFVMGLGGQMTLWPEDLLNQYARAGYRVIRFDNRDIGLSTHLQARIEGHLVAAMVRSRAGLAVQAPYTLRDMAADVKGIMDAQGIDQAHLVGISMGGMISQLVAATWPDRVRSVTLMMTSTNSPKLPMPKPGLIARLSGFGAKGHDEASVVKRSVSFWQAIQSPDYPADPVRLRQQMIESYRRAYNPAGLLRQTRAILATGGFADATRRLKMPVAIIHGKADPLVRPAAGEQLKYLLPHARLVMIDGMGHDMPDPLLERFAAISLEIIQKA